ncbi:MAG: ABC transporter permease [Solirubrobacteraceae bacterium]
MTDKPTPTPSLTPSSAVAAQRRPAYHTKPGSAFVGLLNRDLRVLRRTLGAFIAQIVLQPLLLVFTFTYVLPHIGIGFSAGQSSYATLLVPGLLAATALSTGISAVTTPLSADLGGTREIDDRALAPISIGAIAREKILVGAVHAWLSALAVLPVCELVSATPVQLQVHSWPTFIVMFLLLGITSGALGMTLGAIVKPEQIGILYGVFLIPIQFLGCVYYPWSALHHIHWVQIITLANPLTYLSEGTRSALTPQVPHMPLTTILIVATALALTLVLTSTRLLRKRLQT